ncbi:SDR family oxidoreductase [Rhizobiaceae bacterium BDR2-2]|uniref:Phenolphthiocerol/phthiocerol polyketide synthase subunit E n=1 Tax=Ectorhizobium quercum TaxID=2965071 RepID=A0AAE3SU23_9HYPH|nr:type I polyketide synthase [Ectorhizobium quercum]MCX8996218.1 SDR family oxidoreductase [Ectorhizobium quercum]MCX8998743.1 SDR family oxidoreductase [Ectorhizobium quercum]
MMQTQIDASPNDIAIVGMALRVPGARTVDAFWQNLRSGTESIRTLSEEELIAAGESQSRILNPNYVRRTADMPDMEMFDADFFGLSPKEAAIMDPQHRQFLECAWEAMEDAGRTPNTIPGPVGVFAGCGMGSYFYFNVCSNRQLVEQTGMFLLRHTGNDKDFLATRASFAFNLRGPSVNVQTACSTSLVAVHYGCQSLLNGETDMVLAGGVTIELPHRRGYIFHEGEILSPDGRCRPFDHRAAGTVFGSGAGVVVLRRLSDAIADGDIIHAVIKATAVNNDGATKAGYLAPSVTGQAEAIIEAQGLAGIDADTIQYVECHGTGTALGDPIEIEALTQAFRQTTSRTGFCHVGSVKANIGHLDTAAGVVSLIKATLALKNGEIPPVLGFEKPNSSIDFDSSPFTVNDALMPWPDVDGPRRAAVNSLGVGGTNAHVILEQAPVEEHSNGAFDDEPQILLLSARHRKALDRMAERLGEAIASRPALSMADTAYTLHAGRQHFEHRRVLAVRGRRDAIAVLSGAEPKRLFSHTALDAPAGSVFLMPGGGAQHAGMAAVLYAQDGAFRASVDEGLSYLAAAVAADIRDVWFGADGEAADRFLRPSLQLPAILIVEVAIARLWMDRGVRPAALIGHSMGENAAACIAGVMTYRDAVNLVRLRGELFDTIAPGGMLSVPLSPDRLSALLPPELDLASVNAPELCVVSGRDEDIDAFRAALAEKGIDATRVAIDIAAHSRMLDGILPKFEAFLRGIRLEAPSIPIMSNLTGDWLTHSDACDPLYWVRHLRSTVLFAEGMAKLSQTPGRIYIEAGPGRTLSSLAKLQPGIQANEVINTLPHPDDDTDDRIHFLSAVGRAWATGLDVDVERSWRDHAPRRASLPAYPFLHQRYFIERVKDAARSPEATDAPLARQADMADWGYRPTWKQALSDAPIDAGIEPRSWLVFMDDTGLGAKLTARLTALGHSVTTVSVGDAFGKIGQNAYVLCPEDGRVGYDALVSGLIEDGPFPSHIVHLWLVTGDETHRPGSSFFDRLQEHGFYSLFHLAQAMGDASLKDCHIDVVTNGMQRVGDEALPHPGKATALGPGLVIAKELENTTIRLIDIDRPAEPEARNGSTLQNLLRTVAKAPEAATAGYGLDQLWDDLFATPASEVVAYRKGRRWIRHYERLPLRPADAAQQFRQKGVYLLTGGLGDLSLVMARELAGRFAARLVLLGRTRLPERSEWTAFRRLHAGNHPVCRAIAAIGELEALDAEVLYITADVRDPEQMARAIETAKAKFGALHGVLHTAGIVDDNLIQLKSFAETENVLSPKVYGTAVLDRLLEKEPLDLFVLFSSTSTDTGPAGQVDYVAANAYLNAYAESRAGIAGRRTVAVHWGIWNEVGIAARAAGGGSTAAANGHQPAPAHGPLFEQWVEDAGRTQWLQFTASPERHWMWSEHRLVSGLPILPGTGYIELIAQAMAEYGIDGGFEIRDLIFLSTLDIADGTEKPVRVRLEQQDGGLRAYVAAGSEGGDADTFHIHAEASVHRLQETVPGRLRVTLDDDRWTSTRRAEADRALPSAQENHIKFGPRWSVLRAVSLGNGDALARLALPAAFAADIEAGTRLHPGLLDIATGYAMELIAGYDRSGVLWAPVSYGSIRVHDTLPSEVLSHVRLSEIGNADDGYAAFDVTIARPDGTVVLEVERFTIKRLADNVSFASPAAQTGRVGRRADAAASPAAAELAAQVRQGILPSEGFEALSRALATGQPQPIVSTMPLDRLRERANRVEKDTAAQSQVFERPDLDSDYVAPRTDIERTLAGYWTELLGVERIGVHDSFFDIGGHSLIAVRLFRMIHQTFSVDLPISVLFRAPTIAQCAELISAESAPAPETDAQHGQAGATAVPTHLVPMNEGQGGHATPLFLCAGMFGNVLNLRHLSLQLGSDRPVYCLQARGLYGGQEPHETFPEMARDYLAEIRAVQPHGPYFLGGFSGGGLVAYEMALQLEAAGEEVALVVMLDTPLPGPNHLTVVDRLLMKAQDVRRDRGAFIAKWLKNRREWAHYQESKSLQAQPKAVDFHNERIHAAFLRALDRYEVKPYGGHVLLLRPKMKVLYRITGGRQLQEGRNLVRYDNGWSPYVPNLTVLEVPGDHDSMVLNPNVRVMSARIRQHLAEAEASFSLPPTTLAAE